MTAEELSLKYFGGMHYEDITIEYIQKYAIDFARLKVREALDAAAENANMVGETQHNNNAPDIIRDFVYVVDSNGPDYGFTVNKDSILNAYNLNNII